MPEVFKNSISRAVGNVALDSSTTIGAGVTVITGVSTAGMAVSSIVVNGNYIAGTKIYEIGANQITVDRASTNTASASNQVLRVLGVTTAYTAPAATKAVLIGGTFANNTNNSVDLTVEIYDASAGLGVALESKIPIPAGSSFVISDAGKTVLETGDEVRVYCDTDNAIDVSLGILEGVS